MNPQRHIRVSIDRQRLTLVHDGRVMREYAISTASRGMGFTEGSFRTPTGNFRIIDKIGHNASTDTIFKGRVPSGKWQPGADGGEDLILARILRLDGLDPENRNTRDRHIYIHGTNDTRNLGRPAGRGCVRMSPGDILDLFPMVTEGMEVVIEPQTRPKGKLFFIDCDSTLSAIEGVDELARARGPEIHRKVAEMTKAAMDGGVPLGEVFANRLDLIRPDRGLCDQVAELYISRMVPGADRLAADLRRAGWTPVILSGGFQQIIEPFARHLGIEHVEAVPLRFDDEGNYAGYDASHPASQNMGKCRVIRDWQAATLPHASVMMGDGASDLETRECVAAFICYSGVADRPGISDAADLVIEDMNNMRDALPRIDKMIDAKISVDLSYDITMGGADMSSKKATKTAAKAAGNTAETASTKTAAKKAAPRGKRYSPEEKQKIIDFIEEHNAKHGRGGQTRAGEEFGVAQLTLASWLKGGAKKTGKKAAKKGAKKAAKKAAAGKAVAESPAATAVTVGGSLQSKLAKLLELDKSIATAEASLADMKRQFDTLKNSL